MWRTVLAVAHVTGDDLDELSGVGFARRLDLDVIAVLERRLAVAAVVRGHIGGRLNCTEVRASRQGSSCSKLGGVAPGCRRTAARAEAAGSSVRGPCLRRR